jgi:predicted PurR-regulated permease PerM
VSLDPAVRWLISHRIRRSRAVAIVLGLVALAVAGFMYATIPTLAGEARKLGGDFPGFVDDLMRRSPSLRHLIDRFDLQPKIESLARNAPTWLSHQWLSLGTQFFGALFSTLLVVVLTIYFMADLPRLRRAIVRLFPRRHRPRVQHATTVVIEKVGAYMIGNLVISLIAGVTSFAAMEALRVPFALPLAVAVAITDLIPLVGATLGAAICVIVAFATTDLWPNTVLLLIFFVLYQQLENYLIAPRVLRHAVALPAVAVLLVALVGGTMLGLVGALMAVPIAAAVRVIVTPMLAARDEEDAAESATVHS